MRSNLRVKIAPHVLKCGTKKLFCRANFIPANFISHLNLQQILSIIEILIKVSQIHKCFDLVNCILL